MPLARRMLYGLFADIRFTSEMITRPLLLSNPALFANQLGEFYSNLTADEIKDKLKRIEREAGRTAEAVKQERVSLDIDLLALDDAILKPEDMKKAYVIQGLNELNKKNI